MFERERRDAATFGADLFDDVPEVAPGEGTAALDAGQFRPDPTDDPGEIPAETLALRDAAHQAMLRKEAEGHEERDLSMVVFQDWVGRRITSISGELQNRAMKTTEPLSVDDPKITGLSNDILTVVPSLKDSTTGKTYGELFGNDLAQNMSPEVFQLIEEVLAGVRRIIQENTTAESQDEALFVYIQKLQRLQRVEDIAGLALAA